MADISLFDRLKESLKTREIDGETFWVAEGDTLLDIDQLEIYAALREKADEARRAAALADQAGLGLQRLGVQARGLIALTQNGKVVRWAPDMVLAYRVARQTFVNPGEYETVVDAMVQATEAWERTCGVSFAHKAELDDKPGIDPAGAVFAVRSIAAGGVFIASAFFPNDPINRRRVLIDPSFFTTDFDRVGVLRHELGHVLGFRHEHIHKNAPPSCPHETDFDAKYLTEYDPQSVMHYFCGNVGSRDLKITDVDRVGAQQIYGPPRAATTFVS